MSRSFSLTNTSHLATASSLSHNGTSDAEKDSAEIDGGKREQTILRTEYKATTNRMLRVAVNGFMESLGVVLGIMEELDVDVIEEEHT